MKCNYKPKKAKAEKPPTPMECVEFGLYVVAVALNNLYGFGADRLSRLEAEVNRIIEEEFGNDMEKASYELAQRIEQIRGKKIENKRAN